MRKVLIGLAGQKLSFILLAAVKRHVGVSGADTTTPQLNALALVWLSLQHSLWGEADSTDWTLVRQRSNPVVPVAAVRRNFSR